jgi:cytochrome c-type biogenesis protein CcmH/NrfG
VVRLRPDSSDAHLNLGVALAKQRRFAEAATEFEAVLRLDPANSTAKKYLEQTRELQGKNGP